MATIIKPADFVDTRPFVDQSEVCPVVQIKTAKVKGNPDGITEINVTDFDPKKHTLVNSEDAERIPQMAKKAAKKGPFDS